MSKAHVGKTQSRSKPSRKDRAHLSYNEILNGNVENTKLA